MDTKDPLGYYARLGVVTTASTKEIKAAFRQRAKQLHPDRNKSVQAKHQFQQLSEAYQILIDPNSRAEYDTQYLQFTKTADSCKSEINLEPITCSYCKKVTAQPRYIFFYRVISLVIVTVRTPIQGVFCHKCAEKTAVNATILTFLLGWWGLPWGVIYSTGALINNISGGRKPCDINVQLLTYQAYYFAMKGKYDLAYAIVLDAQELLGKLSDHESQDKKYQEVKKLIQNLSSNILSYYPVNNLPKQRLKKVWSNYNLQGTSINRGALASLILIGIIAFSLIGLSLRTPSVSVTSSPPPIRPYPSVSDDAAHSQGRRQSAVLPQDSVDATPVTAMPDISPPPSDFVQSSLSSPSPVSTPVSLESINPIPTPSPTSCVRQTVADNGNLLPTTSRYVDGYPTRFNNGYSKIMVDNSRNNTDMLVKLYRLDSEFSDPARIIFLESGAQFVFADLEPGKYDLRYKDLSSCQIVRTEELTVNEFETMTSIRASSITVTLYKVMGGNMETYIIDENDF